MEIDKNKLHLIHIGKTGGTSVYNALRKSNIQIKKTHLRVHSYNPNYFYFTMIRSPIDRFISAHRFEYALSHHIEEAKRGVDTIEDGNLAPLALKNGGHGEKVKRLMKEFDTPNKFAENMLDNTELIKIDHIQWSISKYFPPHFLLDLKINKKLFFVGRQEYFNEDMRRFNDIMNIDISYKTLRKNHINEHLKSRNHLSDLAIQNIKTLYERDYHVIEEFKRMNLIDKKYLSDEV